MKKNLIKIASLLLVLAMIFSFAACKKDKDNGDSTAPSESSDIGGSTGDGGRYVTLNGDATIYRMEETGLAQVLTLAALGLS